MLVKEVTMKNNQFFCTFNIVCWIYMILFCVKFLALLEKHPLYQSYYHSLPQE